MQKAVLILIPLLHWLSLFAQPPGIGLARADVAVKTYGILPDNGYSIERILKDSSLVFINADSLRPSSTNKYWLKIEVINKSRYAQPYWITVLPNIDNTLFSFDEDANSWIAQRGGLAVDTDKNRLKGQMRLILQGGLVNTCYMQVKLNGVPSFTYPIKTHINLEQESATQAKESFVTTAWVVSLAILLILVLHNLHVYYRFRDRTVLYFLFVQAGGMIYITAYRSFFKVIFPSPYFSLLAMQNGICHSYSLNNVFMHLSVATILYGFVQMARSYLQTKTALPRWDSLLRYGLSGYLIFTAVVALVNITGFYINGYTILYDNMLVLVVTGMILATSIVAYQHKLPSAPAYLFANVLPLLLVMSMALCHILIGFHFDGNFLLPDLVIVSQALFFSIAIVSRIQLLQEALLDKEEEARQLAFEIGQGELRHREIELENSQIQSALREAEWHRKVSELETQKLSVNMLQQKSTTEVRFL